MISNQFYPECTETCTVCGAIYEPGKPCGSCGTRGEAPPTEAAKPEPDFSPISTLRAIATVDWRKWEDGMNTPENFIMWARNIANHSLRLAEIEQMLAAAAPFLDDDEP